MKNYIFFSFVLFCLTPTLTFGQNKEKGPWWPHPIWGPNDQAGSSNWITPEKVLQASSQITVGKVYELGHPYERGMAMVGQRSYNLFIPSWPTHGPIGENNVVYMDEFVTSEIGQVGTQFDGPGHVGQQMTMADGSVTEVFYNGYSAEDMRDPYGLKKLGIENVKPILTKGILIDIAGYKNIETLDEGYVISLNDVKATLKKQGQSEDDIENGDALLFNFGWWRYWPQQKIMEGTPPYISDEVIEWIIDKKPSMVGSDTNLDGPLARVHTEITMKNGIFNLELMKFDEITTDEVYQFMFIFTPLPLKGATGSPGRPIAIK